jgi:hypothetical protein
MSVALFCKNESPLRLEHFCAASRGIPSCGLSWLVQLLQIARPAHDPDILFVVGTTMLR